MQVKVRFIGHYEKLFGAEKYVELQDGASLHDLAKAVCTSEQCYQEVFDESGKPKPGVGIEEKHGRKLKLLDAGNAKLSDKDLVIFFPHMSV